MVAEPPCHPVSILTLSITAHHKKVGVTRYDHTNGDTKYIAIFPDISKSGSRPQKSPKKKPKNGSLNRDLLKFFNRYGIFWVPPDESSCPDGSKYV